MAKIGRNDPCPCGSGKKYKKCCTLNTPMQSSGVVDFDWKKLRKTDDELARKFMQYFSKEHPGLLPFAWEEFHCFEKDAPEMDETDPLFFCAFLPYFFYNWVPDEAEDDIETTLNSTIAEAYLSKYPSRVSSFEKQFINRNLKINYSFYEVLAVNPGASVRVKDLLCNREFIVKEKIGSQSMEVGLVILARVMTTGESSLFVGMHPQPLLAPSIAVILEFKQQCPNPEFDEEDLSYNDITIRKIFFDLIAEMKSTMMPILKNTDGDDLLSSKLIFNLSNPPEEVLEKLLTLGLGDITKEEVLEDAAYSEDGKLDKLEFPWLVADNKLTSWDNTVFAHITLCDNKLTIHVNSSERAEKAKVEVTQLLGDMARYKITVIEDMVSQLKRIPEGGTSETRGEIDVNEHPELKEKLFEMHTQHWECWLDSELPALQGKTPRQAAKTKNGRELLEALFTDFHSHNTKLDDFDGCQFPIDLVFLRSSLGMD